MARSGVSRGQMLRQLVQTLRSDLNLLSNEAKKKYPAVREAAERGAMKLKSLSETRGFSIEVLAETDDVVHPLLFACETKNPRIVQISLSSLQKLIQYKAVPQKSVDPIVATLHGLMEGGVEELKILQTILLLVTATDIVQEKSLTKVLFLCFKLYGSRDTNVHNTAGVAIRQIVSASFERMNAVMYGDGGEEGREGGRVDHKQLPVQARDAYLLFQDICFLTNGDPAAWLPGSLEMDLSLGLELLETALRTYPTIFTKEKLFNLLLTERVCPLVIKLFSPTSKYRHPSPSLSALTAGDKPTFSLSVRLLRILNVLIREFYSCLITQCEIFLSMLVKFLDSDKPLWQRTLALEVLYSFCNQPLLLRSFCESYDMQEHSSKIFGDIINALGGSIQSNFTISSPVVQLPFGITSSSAVTNNSTGHVIPSSPGVPRHTHLFNIRSSVLQVESLPPGAHSKPIFLEMLDKTDVPVIPEGYPLVVAMDALMDAVRSVSLVVNDQITPTKPPDIVSHSIPKPAVVGDVKEVMVESSWSGVLAALALLLDACGDQHTTGMILKAHKTFIQLCGKLSMTTPRDAFLTSLCKASLPPKYAMSFITQRSTKTTHPPHSDSTVDSESSVRHAGQVSAERQRKYSDSKKLSVQGGGEGVGGGGSEGGGKVSTPVLHRSGGAGLASQTRENPSGLVTIKNLQCISTLLQLIDHHGDILDTAWLLVITTVQHIIEVFGLKPVSTGALKPGRVAENSSLVLVSVEKRSEVLEITDKLTHLFKSTQNLSDSGVLHLINALSQLSTQATSTRELSLFPMASLLETGTTNLGRVNLIWEPITSHLIQVCSQGDQMLHSFAADVLSTLIRIALEQGYKEDLQLMLLSPLEALTAVHHTDVRQKQLECVSHILHSSGQSLQSSWSVILNVISSATHLQSEVLVRAGFQNLQLVITDFLPALPTVCLPICVEVAGQYGLQTLDINISLTSIGLLWNTADYLYQNRGTLQDSLEALRTEGTAQTGLTGFPDAHQSGQSKSLVSSFLRMVQSSSRPVFDSVWMLLFRHLSDLCVDERAAVRKSASQTLFSTISAHGTLLHRETWQGVLWQVFFPLLERVNQAMDSASTSSFQTSLLIHHTRDTAQKQWAETQVLTLRGTARLFETRWNTLASLEGFERAWTTLLQAIRTCACSNSSEVSIAAMKSFHSIVQASPQSDTGRDARAISPQESIPEPSTTDAVSLLSPEQRTIVWTNAWHTWHTLGVECVCNKLPPAKHFRAVLKAQKQEEVDRFFHPIPSQNFLVHMLKIFPLVFSQLKPQFSKKDFQTMVRIFHASLLMPTTRDVSPFLVPSSSENLMSSIQKLVLKGLGVIFTEEEIFEGDQEAKSRNEGGVFFDKRIVVVDMKRTPQLSTAPELVALFPSVLDELLKYTSFASNPHELIRLTQGSHPTTKLPVMVVNCARFSMAALSLAVQLYRACVSVGVELPQQTSENFLKALHIPLHQKHQCPHPSVWVESLSALLLVLETALPSVLRQGESSLPFWRELAAILEDFLFNPIPEGMEVTVEKMREYEAMDIKVIEMIKRDILPASTQAPREFLERLTSILNQGSIHSATDHLDGDGPTPNAPFRENFARACFEALLQFSFIHSQGSNIDATSQLALNALLERCEEVLLKFVADERLSGSCPLPRARMNEVALVLKSVTVLISTLREAQMNSSAKIDATIWQHVAKLYPALVQCITCSSNDVRTALKEALLQFSGLIHP